MLTAASTAWRAVLCLILCLSFVSPALATAGQGEQGDQSNAPGQAAPQTGDPASTPSQEILTIATRPGVTERVLVTPPQRDASALLVLFPGGNGAGQFSLQNGQIRLGTNFLVRSIPLFAAAGLLTVDVDLPSDQPDGMTVQFRAGDAHAVDVSRIVDELRARWSLPIILVGTSNGTISAAHAALALPPQTIDGLVLTSTLGERLGPRATGVRVSSLPVEQIVVPTLFVHHRDDGCLASQYSDALALRMRMTGAPADFVTVLGGDPPQSDPCDALSAHGYLGKEQDVVNAIATWIAHGPIPSSIGP
jgi:pimeloyl-ACP methyl ester carboxylesterase